MWCFTQDIHIILLINSVLSFIYSSTLNTYQYLQIDMGILHLVTATATQGRYDYNQWVTQFKIHYSVDGSEFWRPYKEENIVKVINSLLMN